MFTANVQLKTASSWPRVREEEKSRGKGSPEKKNTPKY